MSHKYRPLGLGYCNLGSLLMRMGLPYDSETGRVLASQITNFMTATAISVSSELASIAGAYWSDRNSANKFRQNDLKEDAIRVLKLHQEAEQFLINRMVKSQTDTSPSATIAYWPSVLSKIEEMGLRNSQVTVLAPTGTIGFLMDCDTTGIEPDFALIKYKSFHDGHVQKTVNQAIEPALVILGYGKSQIVNIMEILEKTGDLKGAIRDEHLPVFDCAMGKTSVISPSGHIKMMAAVQPFLSGAISKSVNVPSTCTPVEIGSIYESAWKLGIKSIAVYRDGCKVSQILTTNKREEVKMPNSIIGRKKLPKTRNSKTIEAKVGSQKIFLTAGEYDDGSLGEIFINMAKGGAAVGILTDCFCRAVSLGLQYGIPLKKFVEHFKFTRFEPSGMVYGHPMIKSCTSIIDYIFKALELQYEKKDSDIQPIATDSIETFMGDAPTCDKCGNLTVRSGSCYRCTTCGNSLGCS